MMYSNFRRISALSFIFLFIILNSCEKRFTNKQDTTNNDGHIPTAQIIPEELRFLMAKCSNQSEGGQSFDLFNRFRARNERITVIGHIQCTDDDNPNREDTLRTNDFVLKIIFQRTDTEERFGEIVINKNDFLNKLKDELKQMGIIREVKFIKYKKTKNIESDLYKFNIIIYNPGNYDESGNYDEQEINFSLTRKFEFLLEDDS